VEKPRLRRDLQVVPLIYEERRVIVFLDPFKLSGGDVALDAGLYPLLEKLNGRYDRPGLRDALADLRPDGAPTLEEIDALLARLDELFLLDSEQFQKKMQELRDEFHRNPDREPVFAGKAYSAEPDALRAWIKKLEEELPVPAGRSPGATVTGLLAPHIDTAVAGPVYVDVYRRIKAQRCDRVIVLGINHREQNGLYSVLNKGFLTPFGRIAPDRDFIESLTDGLPPGTLAPDDFGHKVEHSIEFQTVFLRHYLGPSFAIVPVLCGGLQDIMNGDTSLLGDDRFRAMYERLNRLIADSDGRTLVIAAVDFSHIGFKFGHGTSADDLLPRAREQDRNILSLITQGDAEEIYRVARDTGDPYNVCGLPAIILFTLLMRKSTGETLVHETYREEATDSAVTYASMMFERKGR